MKIFHTLHWIQQLSFICMYVSFSLLSLPLPNLKNTICLGKMDVTLIQYCSIFTQQLWISLLNRNHVTASHCRVLSCPSNKCESSCRESMLQKMTVPFVVSNVDKYKVFSGLQMLWRIWCLEILTLSVQMKYLEWITQQENKVITIPHIRIFWVHIALKIFKKYKKTSINSKEEIGTSVSLSSQKMIKCEINKRKCPREK